MSDWLSLKQWLAGQNASGLEQLHFEWGPGWGWAPALILPAAVALIIAWRYWPRLVHMPLGLRRLTVLLRALVIALVCFLLLEPRWVGFKNEPGSQYVLLLFDDSRSMNIQTDNRKTRGQLIKEAYRDQIRTLREALGQRFQLAQYRFGKTAHRLRSIESLTFQETESDPENAIQKALSDYEGIPVAAVLLFSDGVGQPRSTGGSGTFASTVPIFTLGVGQVNQWADLAIDSVQAEKSLSDDRPIKVKARIEAEGLNGQKAVFRVFQGDVPVVDKSLILSSESERREVVAEFVPKVKDWQTFRATVELVPPGLSADTAAPRDLVPENNQADFLVDQRDQFKRILYFCGRPNWENKFVRRALAEDDQLLVTHVLRISAAETKFVYRGKRTTMVNPLFEGFYGVEDDQPRYDESVFLRFGGSSDDAGKGFPETEEALFKYDLVILGDIEANFFSQNQFELLRDFVRKRGGALLFLGGPHSFSEGRYRGTVLETLLPVLLENPTPGEDGFSGHQGKYKVVPTVDGFLGGAFALNAEPTRNKELWADLPALSGLNKFAFTRPASSVLAEVDAGDANIDGSPFFVFQRYGEGRVMVLSSGATWVWHMRTALEDNRYGRFWRQLVRNLVLKTPQPIQLRDKQQRYAEQASLPFSFLVRDDHYDEKTGLQLTVSAQSKDDSATLPVDESLTDAGIYLTRYRPESTGMHRINLMVKDQSGKAIGSLEEAVLVEPDTREFRQARLDGTSLAALADQSGGEYRLIDQMDGLESQIPWQNLSRSERVKYPFWHFKGFLIMLVLFFALEWYLRRKWGHA